MNMERHTILPLVSAEQTTLREARRLPAAWADEDEAILRVAVCVAVAWILQPEVHGFFGGIDHAFTVLQPGLLDAAHYALAHIFGGLL